MELLPSKREEDYSMKTVDYKDSRGRWYRVLLPEEILDVDAPNGVPVGPPDIVDELDLPEGVKTNIHNELFYREVWTRQKASVGNILIESLQSALRVDASRLLEAFKRLEKM